MGSFIGVPPLPRVAGALGAPTHRCWCGRFTVVLRCAGDDIALQLKCSFLGRPMLVCTAQQGRLWVSDECCAVPRLSPGGVLELIISTQEHGYQVGPPAVGAQTPPHLWVLRPPDPQLWLLDPQRWVLRPPNAQLWVLDPQL